MASRTVLCFGTFDGLDEGHRFFIRRAVALGDRLVILVARDAHVRELKRKSPMHDEAARLAAVLDLPEVHEGHLSDSSLGSYRMLRRIAPDQIVLGFDQDALREDLVRWMSREDLDYPITVIPCEPAPDLGRT